MGHRLDSFPCVTKAEISNPTYKQNVIVLLKKTHFERLEHNNPSGGDELRKNITKTTNIT